MGAKLLYRDGQSRDASADLLEAGSFLGRANECVVRTEDAMVSRRNCKFSVQAGQWYVEDLGSANGTYVTTAGSAERRITREALAHGDIVRCGSLQVRFVLVADAAPAKPVISAEPATPDSTPQAAEPSSTTDLDKAKPASGDAKARTAQGAAVSDGPKPAEELLAKLQEDFKKVSQDLESARSTLKDAQEQREQTLIKFETLESEAKRLRNEASTSKEALESLTRQAKKDKERLIAETKEKEELRSDVSKLRSEQIKALSQIEELKLFSEAKDRQIASSAEDVRRSKKEVEGLNAQLVKLARERDEQIRNINSQTGDVDRLRDILKEREKIIEEQRVGLVSQESQLKDLRRRIDELEREGADLKGKHENLRERYGRMQQQNEELHQLANGQQQTGNEQVLLLSQENRTLRQDAQAAGEKFLAQSTELKKLQAEIAELDRQCDKLDDELKAARQNAERAAAEAAAKTTASLSASHADALKNLTAELEQAKQERDALKSLPTELEQAKQERDALKSLPAELEQAQKERNELHANLTSAIEQQNSALVIANQEREQLRLRVLELEAQFRSAIATTQAMPAHPGGDVQLVELKAVAAAAYEGISDSFGSLRKNLVDLEEGFDRFERAFTDKDAARRLRQSLEEVQNCFEDARSQIRSLRTVIE